MKGKRYEGKKNSRRKCSVGRERERGRGKRERKKEADKKKRRMGTTGTRVVTFPFEIRVCTYGFQNVERHK